MAQCFFNANFQKRDKFLAVGIVEQDLNWTRAFSLSPVSDTEIFVGLCSYFVSNNIHIVNSGKTLLY